MARCYALCVPLMRGFLTSRNHFLSALSQSVFAQFLQWSMTEFNVNIFCLEGVASGDGKIPFLFLHFFFFRPPVNKQKALPLKGANTELLHNKSS